MRKRSNSTLILTILLATVNLWSASVAPESRAAVPPPPPTVESTAQIPRSPTQSLPAPSALLDLSAGIEERRVLQAFQAVLDKYAQRDPRYQMSLNQASLEGEWANVVVRPVGAEPLTLLAHRSDDGVWQALLPSEQGLYLQWWEQLPLDWMPLAARSTIRAQAARVDALRQLHPLTPTVLSFPSQANETERGPLQSMRNPAAVYCSDLGYEYTVLEAADGSQRGICQMPNNTSCDAWELVEGRCGQEYNACAQRGLGTVTQSRHDNPFTPDSAVCVDADGREVITALEAANLIEQSSGVAAPPATIRAEESLDRAATGIATLTAFDWRNYNGANWMTTIKDQGICGSCWAFAAVGVAEAAVNIGSRNAAIDPNMSEQYLVTDCADAGDCAGGWGTSALQYIRDYGIPDEACLPYHDGDYSTGCTYDSNGCMASMCRYCSSSECSDYRCSDRCGDWSSRLYSLARVSTTWSPSRDTIKNLLIAHGPLAVSIYMAGSFDTNGIYRCSSAPYTNHGVSIVGYNDAGGYWIVRNSWGSGWNGNGYFNVAYGNCLIENYVTYADLVACDDVYERNDSTTLATWLAYGQTRSADICSSGDEDFYAFTGATGDRVVIDIDASSAGSLLDSYIYLIDSNGATVLAEHDDERSGQLDSHLGYQLPHDGTYYVRVRDYANDGGTNYTYSIHLLRDNTNPSAAVITPAGNSWINPTTQAVTTSVSDGESGIRNVVFYWHDADWDNPSWDVLYDDWDPSDGWTYTFDTSLVDEQAQECVVFIYAYDWASNYSGHGAYQLGIDRTPPVVTATIALPYGDAPFRDFRVRWGDSTDNLSGIAGFDVQTRTGSALWSDLLVDTTDTIYYYVGLDGQTYYFRVRARDEAGNQSAYAETQHTVAVCPTPPDAYEVDDAAAAGRWIVADEPMQVHTVHIEGDRDWVRFYAAAGITYTLSTTNTGGHADTVLYLYAPDMTLINSNDDYPDMWPSSRLDWQPVLNGFYWAMVEHWDPWAYGCTTEYGLQIVGSAPTPPIVPVFMPLVVRN